MRLIDADSLWKNACELEELARLHLNSLTERNGSNGSLFNTEWKTWSAILNERTAFKHDVFDAPTIDINKWIPMSERPPEIGQYVLVSMDMNYVATATYQGDYWESTFDLDWEEVLAWQPTPKPFEVKK